MIHAVRRYAVQFFLLAALGVCSLQASTIALGYVSFDVDNPINGQNSFTLYNLTGPTYGCTVDFQICDNVSIETATLSITYLDVNSAQQSLSRILASPALPGPTAPANFIFASTFYTVLTAQLSGTIAPLSFLLNDGSTFTANPSFIATIDIQNSGIGLITVSSDEISQVPEPGTTFITAAFVVILSTLQRRRAT